MPDKRSFYITTTLPYVNAEPHIGFAMEIVQADIIARAKRLQGFDVFFNTGADEHGQKIYTKALEAGMDTQKYVDKYAKTFKELVTLLNLSEINFIQTTSESHKRAAQEIWQRCANAGDIYKKNYKIKYCVGCELEKTDSELVDGRCSIHPDRELEVREEENYFFRFSRFGDALTKLYGQEGFMVPEFRINEMHALIERGLKDFSISRLRSKMPWGVSVPGDDEHVMYVWFDALTSYISTLSWPRNVEANAADPNLFNKFWANGTPVQFAGKDQVRQQAAMWQSMLISAGLPNTRQIVIHGFINLDGQKMSKSLGNVLSPKELIDEYGVDALRYFIAREFNQFEDSDISVEKLKLAYNASLANGLGNLVSRLMNLSETYLDAPANIPEFEDMSEYFSILDTFDINKATNLVWSKISELDTLIQEEKPWESKNPEVIESLVIRLYTIARMLNPIMPETSDKIKNLIKTNKKPSEPLFLRKE